MAQAGLELTTSCLPEWSLSAFCHTDSCFPSVEIRIYKNKPLFIYGGRSLLSCCTVLPNSSTYCSLTLVYLNFALLPYLILTIYARLFSTMRAFFDRDPIVVLGILFDLTIYFFQCLFRLLSIRSHFYLNFYIPFLFALLVYFLFGLLLNPLIIWTFKTIFFLFPFPSLWFYLFLFIFQKRCRLIHTHFNYIFEN